MYIGAILFIVVLSLFIGSVTWLIVDAIRYPTGGAGGGSAHMDPEWDGGEVCSSLFDSNDDCGFSRLDEYPLGDINPASGLPMPAGTGSDVAGNAFGTDWSSHNE